MSKNEYLKTKSNSQRLKILINQLAWFEESKESPLAKTKELKQYRVKLAVQLADLVNPIPENL